MSYASDLREENRNKEIIYSSFEAELKDLEVRVNAAKEYLESDSFEEQDRFIHAISMWKAYENEHAGLLRVKSLYKKPYFAHIRMAQENDSYTLDCFLTDNETLNEVYLIEGNPQMCIVPFKQDRTRSFFSAAFHCYQAKTGDTISVPKPDGRSGMAKSIRYAPELIRDVEIFQRQIKNIVTYLPKDTGEEHIDADELLAKRLEDNRSDPTLKNIIATLQLKQFDIIHADLDDSFVVQGCAGSGKTQCLIHRLFFFRDYLEESGWDKVLLITPTQLIRNYSYELVRRYHLHTVKNLSLSMFYKELLEHYDTRFQSRQYLFELSEEYLPDTYLQHVYSLDVIKTIDEEIDKAIERYVQKGCKLTGRTIETDSGYDIDTIRSIADALAASMKEYDEREKRLADDTTYQQYRNERDEMVKNLERLQRRHDYCKKKEDELSRDKVVFDSLVSACADAQKDLDEETKRERDDANKLLSKLDRCIQQIDKAQIVEQIPLFIAQYASLRYKILDKLEKRSDDEKFLAEYRGLLRNILAESKAALEKFTDMRSPDRWLRRYTKAKEENDGRQKDTRDEMESLSDRIDSHQKWLFEHSPSDADKQNKAYREDLEHTHYYLNRIESSIFEQEVWNALASIKMEYGIETVHTEHLENDRVRRSRILYKVDLFFYLRIYHKLHSNNTLPEYNMICIDEGQDLHRVDYELMKSLYPNAVLNVFGDTDQVLHEACGISDWQLETGIGSVYELNYNYRNNAAIVDFCNKEFGSHMTYFGTLSSEKRPEIISTPDELCVALRKPGITVIVKSREQFKVLCARVRDIALRDLLVYIDEKTESAPIENIPCYSVFAAKGLEFRNALVYASDMTTNQQVVACTRAMDELMYYK